MDWRKTRVARDGTHHELEGRPLYAERFDEVLKFHEPGLAPVRRGTEAWHIDPAGREAYRRRFRRTLGFYGGRAAVEGDGGFHHVLPDGTDLYPERFRWCGNFQGHRCTIRGLEDRYLHIDAEGKPLYDARWHYAGDYRGGIAVVQAADGRSTHIDGRGCVLHDCWFLDLDVFHKGFARARDDAGWTHIGRGGRAAYPRRFAMVEPFYNGQARVERFDGGLEVIDESGTAVVELRSAVRSEFAALSADIVGSWRTDAICAAVRLGVFDVLPGRASAIAEECGLRPERAERLLRALGELVLVELRDDLWRATTRGAHLGRDHPLTLADAAIEFGEHLRGYWRALPDALRAGGAWTSPDIFGEVAADPIRAQRHHQMLTSYARHDYPAVPAALELRGDETIIDAGGGLGVLAGMLLEHHPDLRLMLLDRPEVVELIRANAAPPEGGSRLVLHGVDILEPWEVTGDAVVLARVLHDLSDDDALRILRHARGALPVGGRVFIVEMVLLEGGVAGGLCDLHLLVVTGGQERTAAAYARLLRDAGFGFQEIRRIPALPSVIVGDAQ